MSRVLITGSEGTLGQPLTKELESRGHLVWGCDLMHTEFAQYTRADVSDYQQLERAFCDAKPATVYHLAAEFGRINSEDFKRQLWLSNCLGTSNVVSLCVRFEIPLIFASSSEVYGDLGEDGIELHEDTLDYHLPHYGNEYAISKLCNELQIKRAIRHEGLEAQILRYSNAYGEGERYTPYRSVVCLFVYRLLKGLPITVYRNYRRPFMHVSDWTRTNANVLDKLPTLPNGSIYNISGEEVHSIETLVDMIKEKLGGSHSEITYMDKDEANVTDKRISMVRAKRELDHECRVKLSEGLDRTIKWARAEYA